MLANHRAEGGICPKADGNLQFRLKRRYGTAHYQKDPEHYLLAATTTKHRKKEQTLCLDVKNCLNVYIIKTNALYSVAKKRLAR